jgi:hypothetical protein
VGNIPIRTTVAEEFVMHERPEAIDQDGRRRFPEKFSSTMTLRDGRWHRD